jgi:hypothetical protein
MTTPTPAPAPVPPDPSSGQPPERTLFRRTGQAPGSRWLPLVVLGVLLLLALAAGWYVLTRPRLVFTNELAAPIRLTVSDGSPVTLDPGATHRQTLWSGGAAVAQWELVRPLSADKRPMGSEVRGSVVVRANDRRVERAARPRGTDGYYFAPLISNASPDLLRITVNAGLEGNLDCGCAVRPGATRVFIGYYPLFGNSTVRAGTADGRSATFRDLGPSVTSRDGTVGLRFETANLRR